MLRLALSGCGVRLFCVLFMFVRFQPRRACIKRARPRLGGGSAHRDFPRVALRNRIPRLTRVARLAVVCNAGLRFRIAELVQKSAASIHFFLCFSRHVVHKRFFGDARRQSDGKLRRFVPPLLATGPLFSSNEGTGGLPAGPATIWLCVASAGFNIDSFTMTAVA